MTKQADNDFRRYDRATMIRSQERLDDNMRGFIADVIKILETNDVQELIKWSRRVSSAMRRGNRRMSAALHVLLILATQTDVDEDQRPDNVIRDVRALGRALNVM